LTAVFVDIGFSATRKNKKESWQVVVVVDTLDGIWGENTKKRNLAGATK